MSGPPRPGAAVLLVTCALGSGVLAGAEIAARPDRAGAGGIGVVAAPPPVADPVPREPFPVFAVADGIALRLVASEVVAVAFHEASYDDARELRPLGTCVVCRNRWKFTPPPARRDELSYIVTDTRGRSTPATSAADVVLPAGEVVTAPVTGTVTAVRRYRLYGRYPDVRVVIRPDDAPDRRVVMLHLAGVALRRGDRVEAVSTRIGVVRGFAFSSQVDRYVRGGHPHVHLEVKDAAARRSSPKGA